MHLTIAHVLQLAAAAVSTPPEPAALWEIVRGVLLFCCTLGIAYIANRVKRLVDLEHILVGVDGKNGLKSEVLLLKADVKAINKRNERIDAVTEYEKQQYQGPDRRAGARRLRDVVHEVEDSHPRKNP